MQFCSRKRLYQTSWFRKLTTSLTERIDREDHKQRLGRSCLSSWRISQRMKGDRVAKDWIVFTKANPTVRYIQILKENMKASRMFVENESSERWIFTCWASFPINLSFRATCYLFPHCDGFSNDVQENRLQADRGDVPASDSSFLTSLLIRSQSVVKIRDCQFRDLLAFFCVRWWWSLEWDFESSRSFIRFDGSWKEILDELLGQRIRLRRVQVYLKLVRWPFRSQLWDCSSS